MSDRWHRPSHPPTDHDCSDGNFRIGAPEACVVVVPGLDSAVAGGLVAMMVQFHRYRTALGGRNSDAGRWWYWRIIDGNPLVGRSTEPAQRHSLANPTKPADRGMVANGNHH